MGLLFLNPPYGAVVADKGHTGDRHYDRLESLLSGLRSGASVWRCAGLDSPALRHGQAVRDDDLP